MVDEIDEKQRKYVDAMIQSRPRYKTAAFDKLVNELDNPLMAELMWVFWGDGATKCLDQVPLCFNGHLRWWKFGQEKRTIRKLLKTSEGKREVWQMLNDMGAWF